MHLHNKRLLSDFREALYNFDPQRLNDAMQSLFDAEASIRLSHPFQELQGPDAMLRQVYLPLQKALPDLERRDYIVMAGRTEHGDNWVGCGGYYTGTFSSSWLDIPPTGHQVAMRFHEFYRIVDDRVVEVQALWDIPELMLQANAWPLAPSLGREWQVPAPATQDGLLIDDYDEEKAATSCRHIVDMLSALKRHPAEGGPEVMEMQKFWHPKMNWYGPAGIGTGRGIAGFRHWHQIPFLAAMPDRGQYLDEITYHFFGDGDYAAVTGWPNMIQTVTDDGWLGIAPAGKKVSMRSLDFWRIENGLIRENWVLVDLLDVYKQLGIDVFARLREFNKARNMGPVVLPDDGACV